MNLDPQIVPGNTGGPNTWNFSTTNFVGYDTLNFAAPSWAPAPYSAQFPQSSVASYDGQNQQSWAFYLNDNTGFYILGSSRFDAQLGIVTDEFSDPLKFMQWPATFPMTFSDVATISTVMEYPFGSYDSLASTVNMNYSNEIDAWGTLTLTTGTYNCLRIKRNITYNLSQSLHDTILGWEAPTFMTEYATAYEWWTNDPNVRFMLASIYMDYLTDTVTQYTLFQSQVTAINENVDENVLNVYPVPCDNYLNLTIDPGKSGTAEIYDANGKLVSTTVLNATTVNISTANLPNGIYLMRVSYDGEENVKTDKFVVKHE